jgi:hypothetical protein
MAKGYPDFFGTSIWPKYGTPIYTSSGLMAIGPGLATDVLTLTANGVLFCLYVFVEGVSDLLGTRIALYADGGEIARSGADIDDRYSILGGTGRVLAPIYSSRLTFVYEVSLSREVPFHNEIVLNVSNLSMDAIDVLAWSTHYIVT